MPRGARQGQPAPGGAAASGGAVASGGAAASEEADGALNAPPSAGRTDRARSCATSTTSSDSLASPKLFFALTASPSMLRQYGHHVEIVSGLVPSASSIRSVLIRLPIRSSIHIRAPPAPQ